MEDYERNLPELLVIKSVDVKGAEPTQKHSILEICNFPMFLGNVEWEYSRNIFLGFSFYNNSIFFIDIEPAMNIHFISPMILLKQNPIEELWATYNSLKDVVDTDFGWICNRYFWPGCVEWKANCVSFL